MKAIIDFIKQRREQKEREAKELDEDLMKRGYICLDGNLHEFDLLEWEGNVRLMRCKKCGDTKTAMVRV